MESVVLSVGHGYASACVKEVEEYVNGCRQGKGFRDSALRREVQLLRLTLEGMS